MEILEILEKNGKELYPEDLEFFETELATGNYTKLYKEQCRTKIDLLRKWMAGDKEKKPEMDALLNPKYVKNFSGSVMKGISEIAPKSANPASDLTPEQLIYSDLEAIRRSDKNYKSKFKDYVAKTDAINAEFVDAHYGFFNPMELDAIITVKQMGEKFLEKYFGTLDPNNIARYQLFSESFFMRHYPQLDPKIVLTQGKNEWRKKENRSSQLDVFLRLKGVQI